jgi:hypothetical protein
VQDEDRPEREGWDSACELDGPPHEGFVLAHRFATSTHGTGITA